MCGNFGLLLLNQSNTEKETTRKNSVTSSSLELKKSIVDTKKDDLDRSIDRSMHEVSATHGILLADEVGRNSHTNNETIYVGRSDSGSSTTSKSQPKKPTLLPAIKILESQTAATEIRGGQAGGFSAFEYKRKQASSNFESRFGIGSLYEEAIPTRVRCVARKRHPLATDLAKLFIKHKKRDFHSDASLTVIGHTRFATSSVNTVPELHPHEWVPFHQETVWLFNNSNGLFEQSQREVGVHLTHNGDFDALEAYGQTVVVDDVGMWLERVLHVPNHMKGDSPKVAGCMDLFRVQGRWAASARLAWIRVVIGSINDVCNGQDISKTAPNTFPKFHYFLQWENFLESVWRQHINNIIQVISPGEAIVNQGTRKQYRYTIDRKSEQAFIGHVVDMLMLTNIQISTESPDGTSRTNRSNSKLALPSFVNLGDSLHGLSNSIHSALGDNRVNYSRVAVDRDSLVKLREELGITSWNIKMIKTFVTTTIRGFLRADLYNCMIEFLSRAEGSFGLQVHCTLEPGVVVIGSKGQPMSMAYDPMRPLCLFASEASALSVPVDPSGMWLREQIDLDSHGEIMRIGEPRCLLEGTFKMSQSSTATDMNISNDVPFSQESVIPSTVFPPSEGSSSKGSSKGSISSYGKAPSVALSHVSSVMVNYKDAYTASNAANNRYGLNDSFHGDKFGYALNPQMKSREADAFDLLNDRISVHEKFRTSRSSSVYSLSNNLQTSMHGSLQGSSHGSHASSHGSSYGGGRHIISPYTSNNNDIGMRRQLYIPETDKIAEDETTAAGLLSMTSGRFDTTNAAVVAMNNTRQVIMNPTITKSRVVAEASMTSALILDCGVEIRSYSIPGRGEYTSQQLLERSNPILSSPLPYDPLVDLVGRDIQDIPSVLTAIDKAWETSNSSLNIHDDNHLPLSIERIAGLALASNLVDCMKRRITYNLDTIDLLISGVEVSLWIAEQFAADLRTIFPQLNVVTVSANKLLTLGNDNPGTTFFAGADAILPRKIDENTCALLISQSGQTFPVLHATRNVAKLVNDRLWIITGCFNSKMQNVLMENYIANNKPYGKDRVINNYSGHRPAEPSSVAAVATWHTLTHLLMCIIEVTRSKNPRGRVIHPWTYEEYAIRIQKWYRHKKLRGIGFSDIVQQLIRRNSQQSMIGPPPPPINSAEAIAKRKTAKLLVASAAPRITMLLSDGCISDMKNLITDNVISNIECIVGTNRHHQPIIESTDKSYDQRKYEVYSDDGSTYKSIPHSKLVAQGKAWGAHLAEPWEVLVLSGLYIFLSVGLGLPIIGLIGDAIARIILAGSQVYSETAGVLAFTPRWPRIIHGQGIGWTLIGLLLQILDAFFFIYLSKNMVWLSRYIGGRPMYARHGKRTIVIVDNPCIHQLAENFCSKLFAQGYSFDSPDVHGASGADHFVHRFTHRVARGLLLVIGRPDGRLCCLAKTESSVILAAKQAAFIRNPDYDGDGSGPEIVTIGHNPHEPSLGLCHNITLQPTVIKPSNGHATDEIVCERKRFIDEYIYDRCSSASKPFTGPILRSLAKQIKQKKDEGLIPYGSHHIDPQYTLPNPSDPMILDLITQSKDLLKASAQRKNQNKGDNHEISIHDDEETKEASPYDDLTPKIVFDKIYKANSNPGTRLAFLSRLDTPSLTVAQLQVIVQQFYECRIASLERYVAYCVMFHAMAKSVSRPWLRIPWDIARSQSNLRVATTASPVSAAGDSHAEISKEVKEISKGFALKLRGYKLAF